jgi:hypothetical protein
MAFAQSPGTHGASVLGKIGREATFLKRIQERDIPIGTGTSEETSGGKL